MRSSGKVLITGGLGLIGTALAERRGDLAAAIECASVSSQARPTRHDLQEHVVELRSRFARQLALGHSSIGSVA
jgi:nucleoside-diphosphate-sugar epimerase